MYRMVNFANENHNLNKGEQTGRQVKEEINA